MEVVKMKIGQNLDINRDIMKNAFTIEDLKKAYEAGGFVTMWSDMGYETHWDSFESWFEEKYIGLPTIDWKNIKFIARPDTWYDEGTEAFLDGETLPTHDYTSALFRGTHEGHDNGEYCCMFEFDWIDKDGNCINSNIPYMDSTVQHKNYVIENAETGEKYNWLKNIKL